jgi:tetratricopeptide (TPR) repeat protein
MMAIGYKDFLPAVLKRTVLLTLAFCVSCDPGPRDMGASRIQKLAGDSATALNADDFERARSLAAEATRLNPQFAEAWVVYGMASVRLGQPEEARNAYERALVLQQARHQKNPTAVIPVFQQIALLVLLGQPAEAEVLLQRARREHPNDPQLALLDADFAAATAVWRECAVPAE